MSKNNKPKVIIRNKPKSVPAKIATGIGTTLSVLAISTGVAMAIPASREWIADQLVQFSPQHKQAETDNHDLTIANDLYALEVNRLNTNVKTLNTNITAANTEKQELETQLEAKNTEITNLNAQITTLTQQKTQLETSLATANTEKQAIQAQLNTANADKATLQTQLEAKNTEITNLNAQITGLNEQITTLDEDITAKTNQISTLNSQISAKDSEIASLTAQITEASEFKLGKYVWIDENHQATIVEIFDNGTAKIYGLGQEEDATIATYTRNDDIISVEYSYQDEGENGPVEVTEQLELTITSPTTLENEDLDMLFVPATAELLEALEARAILSNQVDILNNEKSNLQAQISSLTSDRNNIQSQLNSANADIISLNSQISQKDATISQLNTDLTAANNDAEELQRQLTEITNAKTEVESQLATESAEKAELQTQITAKEATITQLESDLATAQATLATFERYTVNFASEVAPESITIRDTLTNMRFTPTGSPTSLSLYAWQHVLLRYPADTVLSAEGDAFTATQTGRTFTVYGEPGANFNVIATAPVVVTPQATISFDGAEDVVVDIVDGVIQYSGETPLSEATRILIPNTVTDMHFSSEYNLLPNLVYGGTYYEASQVNYTIDSGVAIIMSLNNQNDSDITLINDGMTCLQLFGPRSGDGTFKMYYPSEPENIITGTVTISAALNNADNDEYLCSYVETVDGYGTVRNVLAAISLDEYNNPGIIINECDQHLEVQVYKSMNDEFVLDSQKVIPLVDNGSGINLASGYDLTNISEYYSTMANWRIIIHNSDNLVKLQTLTLPSITGDITLVLGNNQINTINYPGTREQWDSQVTIDCIYSQNIVVNFSDNTQMTWVYVAPYDDMAAKTIVLNPDNTFSLITSDERDTSRLSGTYTKQSNAYSVTFSGSDGDYDEYYDLITLTYADESMSAIATVVTNEVAGGVWYENWTGDHTTSV